MTGCLSANFASYDPSHRARFYTQMGRRKAGRPLSDSRSFRRVNEINRLDGVERGRRLAPVSSLGGDRVPAWVAVSSSGSASIVLPASIEFLPLFPTVYPHLA